ncbi:MAG: hypothetical protein ACXAC7_15340, partial [Candidatus Hodarchaeales archaeon]
IRAGFDGLKWIHPVFEAYCAPTYIAGFTSFKMMKNELLFTNFPEKPKPTMFTPKETGGIRFGFAKNFEGMIQGLDIMEYKLEKFDRYDNQGIIFKPIDNNFNDKLPEVEPIFSIYSKTGSNNLKFKATFENNSNIPQEIIFVLYWLPSLAAEDLMLEYIKNKVKIQSPTIKDEQHRTIASADLNTPILLSSKLQNWWVSLHPSNDDYITFNLFVDMRPQIMYLFQGVNLTLDVNEKKDLEWTMKFHHL